MSIEQPGASSGGDGNPPEYMHPTSRSRWLALAEMFLPFAVFVAIAFLAHWLLPGDRGTYQCDQLLWAFSGLIAMGCVLAWLGIGACWQGWRAWSTGQVPRPGANIFFKTRIRRGRSVRFNGVVSIVGGIAVLAVLAWFIPTHFSYQPAAAPCALPVRMASAP